MNLKKILKNKYWKKEMSTIEIAQDMEMSKGWVLKKMNKKILLIGLIIILVLAGVIGYFFITGQGKTITVKIFFGNIKEDPEVLNARKFIL